jgi:hypothetical protein
MKGIIAQVEPNLQTTSSKFLYTHNLRFRVLRATDFKIFEKTHAALINIKNFE